MQHELGGFAAGFIDIMEVVTVLLVPGPPCEQGLTVVGGTPCLHTPGIVADLHPRSTLRAIAHRHGVDAVDVVVVPIMPISSLSHHFHPQSEAIGSSLAGSTHDPPYKQLLVTLGAGAASMFHVGGRHHVSVMQH